MNGPLHARVATLREFERGVLMCNVVMGSLPGSGQYFTVSYIWWDLCARVGAYRLITLILAKSTPLLLARISMKTMICMKPPVRSQLMTYPSKITYPFSTGKIENSSYTQWIAPPPSAEVEENIETIDFVIIQIKSVPGGAIISK